MTTITALPVPPSRADPANFAARADGFLGAMPLFATQINAVAAETNAASLTALNAPGTNATSTSSVAIGLGTKTFTVQSGKLFVEGQFVIVANTANVANYMHAQVVSYSGTTLVVNALSVGGSGTFNAWTVSLAGSAVGLPISGGNITGALAVAGTLSVTGAATFVSTVAAGGAITSVDTNFGLYGNATTPQFSWGAAGDRDYYDRTNDVFHRQIAGADVETQSAALKTVRTPMWVNTAINLDSVSGAVFQVAGPAAIDTGTTASTTGISFFNGQGATVRVGWIGTNGSATSYNTSSDERLKHNIIDADMTAASAIIDAMQVRSFDWNLDNTNVPFGMIAQELVTVFPGAVSAGPGPDDMLAVDYSKMVPLLIAEIQSLRGRLEAAGL